LACVKLLLLDGCVKLRRTREATWFGVAVNAALYDNEWLTPVFFIFQKHAAIAA